MLRVIRTASTALPLRLLLITLLLAGLALAGDRHCDDTGIPAVGHLVATVHSEDAGLHGDTHETGNPGDLLGLCVSVLAGIAAALLLIGRPRQAWFEPAASRNWSSGITTGAARPPLLSQLCVSRT